MKNTCCGAASGEDIEDIMFKIRNADRTSKKRGYRCCNCNTLLGKSLICPTCYKNRIKMENSKNRENDGGY